MKLEGARDVARFLKRHTWEEAEHGLLVRYRHPGYSGKDWVGPHEALALTLADSVRRLEDENARLREKIRELKGRKR